jgi:uncharacterized OB-fold protein
VSVSRPIAPGLFTETDSGPRLVAGACPGCARFHFPATPSCPYCGHDACDERRIGATGTLFLYTTIATRPPGYRGPLPYGFGVVELPEGLRVVTRLTKSDPTRLRAGLAMRLVVEPLFTDDDGTAVLSWAFAPEGA